MVKIDGQRFRRRWAAGANGILPGLGRFSSSLGISGLVGGGEGSIIEAESLEKDKEGTAPEQEKWRSKPGEIRSIPYIHKQRRKNTEENC
jgi:hypothetical protein